MVQETNDADVLALQALGWLMADPQRASRFFDLTGLDPATIRASAGHPATLTAVLDHLAAHEPDLVACAQGIGATPAALFAARRGIGR